MVKAGHMRRHGWIKGNFCRFQESCAASKYHLGQPSDLTMGGKAPGEKFEGGVSVGP